MIARSLRMAARVRLTAGPCQRRAAPLIVRVVAFAGRPAVAVGTVPLDRSLRSLCPDPSKDYPLSSKAHLSSKQSHRELQPFPSAPHRASTPLSPADEQRPAQTRASARPRAWVSASAACQLRPLRHLWGREP